MRNPPTYVASYLINREDWLTKELYCGIEFAQMLNEMRLGQISEQTVQTFKSLARPLQFDDGLEVTELYILSAFFLFYHIWALWLTIGFFF